ncbi:MAG: CheR family methyltransferase, partial [Candidatus Binatia bacterium]
MTALAAITDLLRRRIGLDPAALGSAAIAHAVRGRARARGLAGPAAYLAALAEDAAEWDALLESVVVPETWFFRDREPFALLSRWARAAGAARSPADPLRVLSLPCATGEEAWSIAITLAAAGIAPAAFRVEALDLS